MLLYAHRSRSNSRLSEKYLLTGWGLEVTKADKRCQDGQCAYALADFDGIRADRHSRPSCTSSAARQCSLCFRVNLPRGCGRAELFHTPVLKKGAGLPMHCALQTTDIACSGRQAECPTGIACSIAHSPAPVQAEVGRSMGTCTSIMPRVHSSAQPTRNSNANPYLWVLSPHRMARLRFADLANCQGTEQHLSRWSMLPFRHRLRSLRFTGAQLDGRACVPCSGSKRCAMS